MLVATAKAYRNVGGSVSDSSIDIKLHSYSGQGLTNQDFDWKYEYEDGSIEAKSPVTKTSFTLNLTNATDDTKGTIKFSGPAGSSFKLSDVFFQTAGSGGNNPIAPDFYWFKPSPVGAVILMSPGDYLNYDVGFLNTNSNTYVTGLSHVQLKGEYVPPPNSAVPEPLTLGLMASGMACAGFVIRKRRKA
jgi:hypothetical protein